MDESLFNRLKSLGVQLGTTQTKPLPKEDDWGIPIEKVLSGREHTNIFGSTFLVENRYPANYQHGNVVLGTPTDLSALLAWSRLSERTLLSREKFLFLDTETSGLVGGAGTIVFMVGLGFWQGEEYRLIQLFLRNPAEEAAFLTTLEELLTPFPILVTYNGKSFDAPLLNNRFVLNGFQSPLHDKHHIDLLSLTRRVWRDRLVSRSLGNLEQEILHLPRGQEEIPGWMVPELYFQYLQTRNASPLYGVFYHNQMDILSLSAVFLHLAELLRDPLNSENPQSLDTAAIARLSEELGEFDKAITLYEASLKMGLPRAFFVKTLYRFADLYRKAGRMEDALRLWKKAAEFDEIDACIEIAKHAEHREKHLDEALQWSSLALSRLETSILPKYVKKQKQAEIAHRIERLKSKIDGGQNRG